MTNNFPNHIETILKWQEWKIPHIVVHPKSVNYRYIEKNTGFGLKVSKRIAKIL
jgi:hypothetical protein